MNRRIRAYAFAVGGAFWLAFLVVCVRNPGSLPPLAALAPLLGLAIAGEEVVVRKRQRWGGSVFSFSAPAHVAAVLLIGPVGAALVAASAVVIVDGLRQESRRYVLLNSSMFGGAAWIAGLVFHVCGGSTRVIDGRTLPALIALIVARYLVTSLIFACGTALVVDTPFGVLAKETVAGETVAAIGEGSLGVLIAFGVTSGRWVIFPFLAPLLAALYSSKATFQRLKAETANALESVAHVVDERDPSTAEHTQRVAGYIQRFTDLIALPHRESERLVEAAKLHDIGKIAVDVATLAKQSRLTEAELQTIRRHPRLSAHLLSPFHFAQEMALYVELHHERFDGRGYYSVATREIPVEAHVLIVADSFDAMTSARPYRPALTAEEAAQELLDKAGTQFHPLVARAFAAMVRSEKLAERLSASELAELRASFARVRTLTFPDAHRLLHPRSAGVGCGVLALVLLGLPAPAPWAGFALSGAALLLLGVWIGRVTEAKRRRSRALALIAEGHSPVSALAAADISASLGWAVFDESSGEYTGVPVKPSPPGPQDLREACNWALRRERLVQTRLSSGRHLRLAEAKGHSPRLVYVLERPPSPLDEELLRLVGERLTPEPTGLRLVESAERRAPAQTDGVLLIELGAFEGLRQQAGQLVAERVVAEAEERLRSLLRADDDVVRLGDDRFGVRAFVLDQTALGSLIYRIETELGCVPVPKRSPPIVPRIRAALGAEAVGDARLAAVLEALAGESPAAVAG